jgi:hypothetical protein
VPAGQPADRKEARRGELEAARRGSDGRFLAGPDADRHTFTRSERRRGYRNALLACAGKDDGIRVYAWIWRKVRGYYRARRRAAGRAAS